MEAERTSPLGARLASWARVIPIDAYGLIAIAIVLIPLHLPFAGRGMCFNDPAWYFHFGHRVTEGAVPYRDFVFQVGPLPIYVDAGFQELFGTTYVASIFAGLFNKIIRVWIIWMISRRLAGGYAAAFLAVFCSLDPSFSYLHHWSTPYSDLFLTLSGLFFLLASRSEGRRELVHLALAGLAAALVVSARQSAAILIGAALLGATAILLARKEYFTPRRFAALWAGFAAGFALVFGLLAMQDALGPAIQQMFLDATSKKAINGTFGMVLDGLTGGAIVDSSYTYLTGFLYFLAIPSCFAAGIVYLASRDRAISSSTVAMLLPPGAICLGLLTRDGLFSPMTDLPLILLTTTTALAVLAPGVMRRWFGIEPLLAVAFGTLPLANNWAHEMSWPGRGWPDVWALVTGLILMTLVSAHLVRRIKAWLCAGFAVAGIVHFVVHLHFDLNPFDLFQAIDGTLTEVSHSPRPRGEPHPMLRGVRMPEWRAKGLEWMMSQVTPGSTCFVYANHPSLYDLLGCTNPTRLDTTIADFPSAADAREVAARLAEAPPDYIIEHEYQWMSPPISLDLEGRFERYESWNPHASMALHMGLRAIIGQYDSLGHVGDAIGPELAKLASYRWDTINRSRIWRRKDLAPPKD